MRRCYTRWLIVGPMDKELALREDRRLLGRLLGEVIGAHVGEETRHRVETVRQSAVRLRRGASGQSELEAQLDALPIDQTLHVVRAFSYFSHLLNIAEDVQQNRRRHAHAEAGSPRRPGSITHALEKTEPESSIEEFISWFARARVSPVLTAHPTEVQRQSILECEREIARLLAAPQSASRGADGAGKCAPLFPAHLFVRAAASLRRPGGGAAPSLRPAARALAAAVPHRRHLGGRRPRAQHH